LAVYSRYIEVCTCDGQHYPSYSETQRRHLKFRKGSTKRKKWCANDCQGRVYFTSDQIVFLPDMRFSPPVSWVGDEAVEHLALQMLTFARWRPQKITTLLRRFKSLKSLTLICIPGTLDRLVSKLVRTPHGYRAPKMTTDRKQWMECYVLDNWRYIRPDDWWNKLSGIKMNIIYLYHDTLGDHWPLTEAERRNWELTQIVQLGKLGPKINDHMQDMETWTEET
jgi:hypothetical protein